MVNIIGILDGKESNIQFYWILKSYIGRGGAESNITFQNPIKLYIGRLNIQYSLYLLLSPNATDGVAV